MSGLQQLSKTNRPVGLVKYTQEDIKHIANKSGIVVKRETKTTEPANHIAVFQESSIHRVWHNEEWWFSVVDVCAILTESPDAGAYWRKLKQRINAEGSQPVTFCNGLPR